MMHGQKNIMLSLKFIQNVVIGNTDITWSLIGLVKVFTNQYVS